MEKAQMPGVGELHVAHVGDPVEGRLGGGVGHAPSAGAGRCGRRRERGLGEHVDQAALAALEHLGQQELDEEQRVEVVAHQAALGQLDREVEDAVHGARALVDGVVHQHVDPAHVPRDLAATCSTDARSMRSIGWAGRSRPSASMSAAVVSRLPAMGIGVSCRERARRRGLGRRPRARCGP